MTGMLKNLSIFSSLSYTKYKTIYQQINNIQLDIDCMLQNLSIFYNYLSNQHIYHPVKNILNDSFKLQQLNMILLQLNMINIFLMNLCISQCYMLNMKCYLCMIYSRIDIFNIYSYQSLSNINLHIRRILQNLNKLNNCTNMINMLMYFHRNIHNKLNMMIRFE